MKPQQFAARPHILVVDDDERIRDLVSRYLWEHEFVVMMADGAAAARQMLKQFEFDALVVDVMMPGETGLEFTNSIRGQHDVPVLLLTALGEAEDRINGLEAGADDYLAKPFEPRELILRLKAILRRTAKPQEVLQPFMIGDLRFDPQVEELSGDEGIVNLTEMEKNLIRALAQSAGEPVSRESLAEICGIDAGERTIDVQVTRLRRKIEQDTRNPRYLQTVRGKGYMLRIRGL